MHRQREVKRHGWLLSISVGAIVLAFMGLSLAITATGTARFAVAMGYRAEVGYVVGGVFDFAKAVLPVALLVLLADAPSFSSPLSDLPASASWPIVVSQRMRR